MPHTRAPSVVHFLWTTTPNLSPLNSHELLQTTIPEMPPPTLTTSQHSRLLQPEPRGTPGLVVSSWLAQKEEARRLKLEVGF